MKTTKRGKLLMLTCAALVAVLACLPLLWFRAQDSRMFGIARKTAGLYESRQVSGDDFYLLQQVKNRTQMNRIDWMVSAGLDGTASLYTPAGSSRYDMTSSDTAADFAASLLTQLHDAEVLPDTWYHVAADNMSSYSGELYTSSDSLGITRLLRYPHAAYDESDPEYNEYPTFALDYDNKTGRLLNLWVQAPLDEPILLSGSPVSLSIPDLLNAWVQWEGLADLGDWTAPYGSDYAETGLYSARGNALLTCVYGAFSIDDVPRAYYSMQLTWQPYDPTPQPGSADLLPAEPLPETSDFYYTDVIAYQWDDDRAAAVFDHDANLILRTDLNTGVQTVFCDVPGCTHTTSSCPARVTDNWYTLVPAGDCVYLVYGTYSPTTATGASGADINAMSDDEIIRWARAVDAGVPLALYTQELEPYTQEDVTAARRRMQNAFGQGRIEMLDGTTRTELARLDHEAVYIGGCDSTYLYGIMRNQQDEEPTRWFRMERATGQYETMPIPDTDHLCGVWNNQLVLFRERCTEPFASDKLSDYSLGGSYASRFQNTSYDVVLYDPVTAQSRRLYSLNENSGSFSHAALYGDSLYLDTILWGNPADTQFNAIRLNLRSGEQTALDPLLGIDRSNYPYGYMWDSSTVSNLYAQKWGTMILFRSNNGQGGESLLLNFAADSVFHIRWQAGESTFVAAESPTGQLLLLSWAYDNLSDIWFQPYQQSLAPASDPTAMTPVALWEPGQ